MGRQIEPCVVDALENLDRSSVRCEVVDSLTRLCWVTLFITVLTILLLTAAVRVLGVDDAVSIWFALFTLVVCLFNGWSVAMAIRDIAVARVRSEADVNTVLHAVRSGDLPDLSRPRLVALRLLAGKKRVAASIEMGKRHRYLGGDGEVLPC